MSKNFVREIHGINNINKQEFYTNKANDLLSTKEHNYIRKETEQYHCLTDNVKQTKATNVRYTDTTAKPNVNYNLLSVDNSQVPKTNTNTISALSLVSALEAKDQQIQKLQAEIALLAGKKPEIVFYAGSGNECTVCDTILTEIDGNEIIIDCLLTLNNVSFNSQNKTATITYTDPFKNITDFYDYNLSVVINTPSTQISEIIFYDDFMSIKFGTAPTSPFTGTIPIEVTLRQVSQSEPEPEPNPNPEHPQLERDKN